MTKKRLLLVAALPLVIAVTLGFLAMLPPGPGVTKANFDHIEKEMTLAQVEATLGKEGIPWDTLMFWQADDGSCAFSGFTDDGVVQMQWLDSTETVLEKIRRWLHLR